MSDIPHVTVTLYFVGDTPEEAAAGLPWDDWDMADQSRQDANLKHVYAVEAQAFIDQFEIMSPNGVR